MVCDGLASSVTRSASIGALASASIGSLIVLNAVCVVTPGKCHLRGARNDQSAWSADDVRLSVAALVRTCANGAGLAFGVTAAYTAPPLLHTNLRSAQALIHSPW